MTSDHESNQPSSGREQRTHTRYPLFLDGMLRSPAVGRLAVKIRDFCRGGMYVAWEPPSSVIVALERDAPVTIEFLAPIGPGGSDRSLNLSAAIARTLPGGVGIRFDQTDADVLNALERVASSGQLARSAPVMGKAGAASVDTAQVIRRCQTLVSNYLRPGIDGFLKRIDERLFLAARDAPNNLEQRKIFDTMAALQNRKAELGAEIENSVRSGLERLGQTRGDFAQAPALDTASLSLVDKDEFEELLIINEMVARAEPRYRESLWQIEGRLTRIASGVVNRANNPLGPAHLCRSVSRIFSAIGLPAAHLRIAYEILEEALLPRLAPLYDETNRYLESVGLTPIVEKEPEPSAPVRARPSRGKGATAVPGSAGATAPEGPGDFSATLGQTFVGQPGAAPIAMAGVAGPAIVPAAAVAGAGTAAVTPMAAAGPAPAMVGGVPMTPGAAGVAIPAGVAATGGTVAGATAGVTPQTLVPGAGIASTGGVAGAVGAPAVGAPVAAAPLSPVVSNTLTAAPVAPFQAMRALLGLQRQVGAGGVLGGAGAGAALGAGGLAAGGAVVPGGAGGAAAAGQDSGGAAGTAGLPAAFSAQEIAQAMASLDAEDAGPWGEESHGQDFQKRLHEVLSSRGGTQRQLGDRERDAIEMMSGIFESLRQDQLVPELLRPQLRRLRTPLHKLALLDDQFLSDGNHPARQMLNRLAEVNLEATLGGGDSGLRQQIDGVVERVAKNADHDGQAYQKALGEIEDLLSARGSEYRKNVRHIVQECEVQQQVTRAKRRTTPDSERGPQKEVSKEWAVWLNRAKALRIGDPVSMKRGGQPPQRVVLAWVGEDHSPFVFVNHKGQRSATMTLQELAMQLRRGSVRPLDRSDLPAVDRALFSTLYRMHDRIGAQALQDPLTGLTNRKRFEALLERALARAVQSGDAHVVAVVRVDGAGALAERGGASAANSLIKKTAGLLRETLGEAVPLARMDEYEFGVLLADSGLDAARATLQNVIAVVQKVRARYKDEKFALNARVGVAGIGSETPSVAALLAEVYAACDAAMPGEVCAPADLTTPARVAEAVDWRAWLERTVSEQAVVLLGQPLKPSTDGVAPIYCELLLAANATEHTVVPARALPHSADAVDAVRALDRLVIRESLKWMARERDLLDRLGGCAINLSAHSLSDPGLMDFVLMQLTESMVPPGRLCFEFGEAAATANLDAAERFVRTLKEFGCRFALDDFGSGEMAQGYLNNLPVDYLKIGGMYTRDVDRNAGDAAVVKSLAEIGRLMGKKTIASEVATDACVAKLKELGVDFVQGPVIRAPLPLNELA